jgi:hypothetical protein
VFLGSAAQRKSSAFQRGLSIRKLSVSESTNFGSKTLNLFERTAPTVLMNPRISGFPEK